jgi:hypothetical protein
MNLRDYGIGRRQLHQGGGRGSGNDHLDELIGCTEFYIYQPPNTNPKGYQSLKLYLESQDCEVIFTLDSPVDLGDRYEAVRVTHRRGEPIPAAVLKRTHSWVHQRNLLHSFFKPLYR